MKICIAFQSIAANEMNGDFILQKKIAGGTLVYLADGMGGLDFPEQASKSFVKQSLITLKVTMHLIPQRYSRELRICR